MFLAGDVKLLQFVALGLDQFRGEGGGVFLQLRLDGPVFARLERLDFLLALDNQAQRRALHAPRRQPAGHLAPQQRRQVEADQVIERAPRLLRVDEVVRQAARVGDGLLHGALGNLVEHDAVHLLVFQRLLLLQNLVQVPRDGLALAVGVGRQVQVVGALEAAQNVADMLAVAVNDFVLHREAVLGVHRAFFRHQVADMAVGGHDLEIRAEIFLQRPRLRGRLDYQ